MKTNSENILNRIDSLYAGVKRMNTETYKILVNGHAEIISEINDKLVNVTDQLPSEKCHVFAVQDLSIFGKGVFISEYYFEDGNFVARLDESGPYGYITKWVAVDTINSNS